MSAYALAAVFIPSKKENHLVAPNPPRARTKSIDWARAEERVAHRRPHRSVDTLEDL
jgi:hypothetical protein